MSSAPSLIALCSAASPALAGRLIAVCSALPLPAVADEPPAWIHLLPAGEIVTVDDRGPYRVADPAALMAASLGPGDRLPLDENHSTDLAAPRGEAAPARGWIVEMQGRADGIWGRVEWTAAGRQLVLDRAYRHISPVIAHKADKTVVGLLRASLVNRPNLRGLAALHQQDPRMEFLSRLREALGLDPAADEAAVLAAVSGGVSLQAAQAAQLPAIARAAGLAETATADAILQAVQALADPARTVPAATVTALQAEIAGLKQARAREKAEAYIDGAIKAGKIAAPARMREHYIARHMAEPAVVEMEIGVMPSLHGRGLPSPVPPGQASGVLDADEQKLVALMGLDPKAYEAAKKRYAEESL